MVRTKDSKRAKRFQKQSKLFRKRTREASKQTCSDNKAGFKSLLNWLLEIHIFAEDKFHGNAEWDATEVATQALIWALLETRNVTAAFDQACKHCDELELKKGQKTYQAFMNTLTHYKNTFADRLRAQFQKKAEEVGGQFWRDESWVLMGFDGSRVTTPRTASNEAAFCAPNYGQGKTAKYRKKKSKGMRRTKNERNKPQPQVPQVWITMMWHMGLRLPWTWRLGPSNSSERGHVMEMLKTEKFPEDTLFCGDAGFVGYALWSEIRRAKGEFLVRVGANVSLLSQQADFKRLRDGLVLCWPKDQMKSGAQPLRLRLVKVKVGKTNMWMLTSVLSRDELSRKQIIRYYKMRWGIEVEFRGLKQTLDNRKLRCRKSAHVLVELDWSIRAMGIAELCALREQIPRKGNKRKTRDYKTTNRSLAKTVRVLRDCLQNLNECPPPNKGLLAELSNALVQKYNNTNKQARYRPNNPDKKPLGDPKIRKLNANERKRLQETAKNRAA